MNLCDRCKCYINKMAAVDWTPLEGIKPDRRGRGYSSFTAAEGERIRKFVLDGKASQTMTAAYFDVHQNQINKIVNQQTNYTRPNMKPTPVTKGTENE